MTRLFAQSPPKKKPRKISQRSQSHTNGSIFFPPIKKKKEAHISVTMQGPTVGSREGVRDPLTFLQELCTDGCTTSGFREKLQTNMDTLRSLFAGRHDLVPTLCDFLHNYLRGRMHAEDMPSNDIRSIRHLFALVAKAADTTLSGSALQMFFSMPEAIMYKDGSASEHLGARYACAGMVVGLFFGYHGHPDDANTVAQMNRLEDLLKSFGCIVVPVWYSKTRRPIMLPASRTDSTLTMLATTQPLSRALIESVLEQGAFQLWVVSGHAPDPNATLDQDVVDAFVDACTERCVSLHVLVDNPAYTREGNKLLEGLGMPLFSHELEHGGRWQVPRLPKSDNGFQRLETACAPSSMKKTRVKPDTSTGGCIWHPLTTGVQTLFEGVTVAIVADPTELTPYVPPASSSSDSSDSSDLSDLTKSLQPEFKMFLGLEDSDLVEQCASLASAIAEGVAAASSGGAGGAGSGRAPSAIASATYDSGAVHVSERSVPVPHPLVYTSENGVSAYFCEGERDVRGRVVASGAFTMVTANMDDVGVETYFSNIVYWLGAHAAPAARRHSLLS